MGDGRDLREKELLTNSDESNQTSDKFREELRDVFAVSDKTSRALSSQGQARLDELTNNHELSEKFPPPGEARLKELRLELQKELSTEVPVLGSDGKPTSLYDKIMRSDKLDAVQKERMLNALAEVKDAYRRIDAAVPADSAAKGYQDVNWKHTRAEVDQVLDAAARAGLSPIETENAMLASIFSDSVKFPQGDPHNKANFLVHNIDGAKAAAEVLPRYLDPSVPGNLERIEAITHAVREHQIAPPRFMSNMAKLALEGRLGKTPNNPLPAEKQALVDSIVQKIANPMESPHVTDAKGASRIAFTEAESALLKQIGVEDWFVPNEKSPWFKTSQAVINGDSLINYASPDGWAKIAAIRGPGKEPWFQDKTVFDSLESTRTSYNDAYSVLGEEAKPLATAGLERTQKAIDRVKGEMEQWFRELERQGTEIPRTKEGKIAFWDAPLKYPTRDEPLNADEQKQFEFAKRIREEVVRRLRVEQGVFDQSFVQSVASTERASESKQATDRTVEERAKSDKLATGGPGREGAPGERPGLGRSSPDRPVSERAVTERGAARNPAAVPGPRAAETSEFFESQEEVRGRESALKVEAKEGAGGLTMVADKAMAPELVKTLEKYNKDAEFQKLMEERISQSKDEKEKERLRQELENYRKLPEADRTRVRIAAAEEAVAAYKSGERSGRITAGRVLAVGGTVIAVGMLAQLLLSQCGCNAQNEGPAVKPTYGGD